MTSQNPEFPQIDRAVIGKNGHMNWVHEEFLNELDSCDRRTLQRELWRCLSALEASFPNRAPMTIRCLLSEALEVDIRSCEETQECQK